MKVLITGSAGFIGNETAIQLLERGDTVIGIDSMNNYYDVALKKARLQRLKDFDQYHHHEFCISDGDQVNRVFSEFKPDRVINLAAQAGVRYSLENPLAYAASNLSGFVNILEACRHHQVEHLVYASSSSVYGANTKQPYSVTDNVDHPLSLYAATKKSNELMAHTYSHLYDIPTTGLRFFTVYGPWGRPDMSYFKFIKNILSGEPIDIYNFGKHRRDFTYIDDIVQGVMKTLDLVAKPNPEWSSEQPDPSTSFAPYRVYNIGNNKPVELMKYIQIIEDCVGKKAKQNMLPLQPGDVPETYANIDALVKDAGYSPTTSIEEGIANFVDWYRDFYKV